MFLKFDEDFSDINSRLLCYVYYYETPKDESNGTLTLLQDWLIVNGYVKNVNYPPNEKFKEHFAELAELASKNKTGLWNGYYGNKIKE